MPPLPPQKTKPAPITSSKLLALWSQFQGLADRIEARRSTLPVDSDDWRNLGHARAELTRASSRLLDSELDSSLDELAPHYEAMLSAVQELKKNVEHEQQIAKALLVVSSALAISSAFLKGDPVALLAAISDASKPLSG